MSSNPISILGFCNPLLDISAEVPADFLDKYQLKPANAILAEAQHIPLYDELVKNFKVEYVAGGAGQNSIRAAQWLIGSDNKTTGFIGCIGSDENGKRLRQEAESDGVHVHYMEDETTPTGTCAVLIVNKDRSMVANLAAANSYKKTHFENSSIQDIVNNAKLFYVTGFFITVSPDTILAVAEHAKTNNKVFTMNLSAPFLLDFFWDGKFEKFLPYIDILFGNETEAAALGKRLNAGPDLKEIALAAAKYIKENTSRPRLVVFTQGSHPTIVASSDGSVQEFSVPLVPKEEIVDTNGAGDSFVGGFLARYSQGASLEEAVAAGNYTAGMTIRTSGTNFKGRTPNFTFTSQKN